MKKYLVVISLMLFCLLACSLPSRAEDDQGAEALRALNCWMQQIVDRDYAGAWSSLTEISQDAVVEMVMETILQADPETTITPEVVRELFASGDPILGEPVWEALAEELAGRQMLDAAWQPVSVSHDRVVLAFNDDPADMFTVKKQGTWRIVLFDDREQ